LFDSGERDCDEFVGPAYPSYEECSNTTTTPSTTSTPPSTTTPMKPGKQFMQFLQKCQTVKPKYNGHPWEKKMTVVLRWSLFRGWIISIEELRIKLAWPL
jgi:hypothetical protein